MPTSQMNTSGIPVYRLYAFSIEELLTQESSKICGTTQGTTQEIKKDGVKPYFKVSEGEEIRMRILWLLRSAEDDHLPKWYRYLFAKHQEDKYKRPGYCHIQQKIYIFDGSNVQLYHALVKMITKFDWKASEIGKEKHW